MLGETISNSHILLLKGLSKFISQLLTLLVLRIRDVRVEKEREYNKTQNHVGPASVEIRRQTRRRRSLYTATNGLRYTLMKNI